jgi:hypothetical protein
MNKAVPLPKLAKCSQFTVEAISGPQVEYKGMSKIYWEGPNLILARWLHDSSQPSLFEEVKTWDGLIVSLHGRSQDIVRRWKLEYEQVINRAFLFLDANSSENCLEAVLLVNASMTELLITKKSLPPPYDPTQLPELT